MRHRGQWLNMLKRKRNVNHTYAAPRWHHRQHPQAMAAPQHDLWACTGSWMCLWIFLRPFFNLWEACYWLLKVAESTEVNRGIKCGLKASYLQGEFCSSTNYWMLNNLQVGEVSEATKCISWNGFNFVSFNESRQKKKKVFSKTLINVMSTTPVL